MDDWVLVMDLGRGWIKCLTIENSEWTLDVGSFNRSMLDNDWNHEKWSLSIESLRGVDSILKVLGEWTLNESRFIWGLASKT